jgi:hypothetical protein
MSRLVKTCRDNFVQCGVMECMLSHGRIAEEVNGIDDSMLQHIMEHGLDGIIMLVEYGMSVNPNLLVIASISQNSEIVKYLIQVGADPSLISPHKMDWIICEGNDEVSRLLIANGAVPLNEHTNHPLGEKVHKELGEFSQISESGFWTIVQNSSA